jgi:hypothetical protein
LSSSSSRAATSRNFGDRHFGELIWQEPNAVSTLRSCATLGTSNSKGMSVSIVVGSLIYSLILKNALIAHDLFVALTRIYNNKNISKIPVTLLMIDLGQDKCKKSCPATKQTLRNAKRKMNRRMPSARIELAILS